MGRRSEFVKSLFQSLLPVWLLLFSAFSWAGVDSSGGGNAVIRHPGEQPILLDLFLKQPDFQDTPPTDSIEVSLVAEIIGFDMLTSINESRSRALLNDRLQVWETNSPAVVALVRFALSQLDWMYTPFRQEPKAPFSIPEDLQKRYKNFEILSAVVFDKTFGARISVPTWNQLGLYSLAALQLHETLRFVQKHFGNSDDEPVLSDESILKITGEIILGQPGAEHSLDQPEMFSGYLQSRIENAVSNARQITGVHKNMLELQAMIQNSIPLMKQMEANTSLGQQLTQLLQLISPYTGPEAHARIKIDLIQGPKGEGTANGHEILDQIFHTGMRVADARYEVKDSAEWADLVESIHEKSYFVTKIVRHSIITFHINQISDRTIHYQGFAYKMNRLWADVGFNILRDYINGDRRDIKWSQRRKLSAAIKKMKAENQRLLGEGLILP